MTLQMFFPPSADFGYSVMAPVYHWPAARTSRNGVAVAKRAAAKASNRNKHRAACRGAKR